MTGAFTPRPLGIAHGPAICYSGYRENQSPATGVYPSREEIMEDLLILATQWRYLRLYDSGPHAELVLEAIERGQLPFRVMLGVNLDAEVSNPNCPWGADYDDETLFANRKRNNAELERAIALARQYPGIIFSVSIGNEASVDWTDHLVPLDHLIAYARKVRAGIDQPVTFSENYVPWLEKLDELVAELDFLSVHTYPVWEYKSLDEALAYTRENYYAVAGRHPHKPVVITEAGWTTCANGRGIDPDNAGEDLQAAYCAQLLDWTNAEEILTFVFEAFDEPWKGSDDPAEPEKHWGLFRVDRSPKPFVQGRFPAFSGDG